MQRQLKVLTEGGRFFEGPRWHDGRWWVSDFYRHAVFTVTASGREEKQFDVEQQPSGLGWLPDGTLLVVSMKDRKLLKRAGGKLALHADLSSLAGGHCNDMVVDQRGRAYVGNFGFDLMGGGKAKPAALVCVQPDGKARTVADNLFFPNGSVITPDGRTLIVGETIGNRYTAFDIADDGSLSNRRVWASLGAEPTLGTVPETLPQLKVAPDGCALDAEGHIWAADAVGARCVRIAAGGKIVDEIKAPPGLGIFACMLGGDDGKTLLLCSAPDFYEHNRAHVNEAVLLTAQVEVSRAGWP